MIVLVASTLTRPAVAVMVSAAAEPPGPVSEPVVAFNVLALLTVTLLPLKVLVAAPPWVATFEAPPVALTVDASTTMPPLVAVNVTLPSPAICPGAAKLPVAAIDPAACRLTPAFPSTTIFASPCFAAATVPPSASRLAALISTAPAEAVKLRLLLLWPYEPIFAPPLICTLPALAVRSADEVSTFVPVRPAETKALVTVRLFAVAVRPRTAEPVAVDSALIEGAATPVPVSDKPVAPVIDTVPVPPIPVFAGAPPTARITDAPVLANVTSPEDVKLTSAFPPDLAAAPGSAPLPPVAVTDAPELILIALAAVLVITLGTVNK